jgi:putative addiction module component (TIGR02574 family)
MALTTISLEVDADVARAYSSAPPEDRRRLQLLLGLRLRELTVQQARPLNEVMDDIGRQAEAQGLQTALSLPSAEQVELIEALIAAQDEADPQPLDDAWMTEIQRRSAEFDAGKVAPIPWSVVRERRC